MQLASTQNSYELDKKYFEFSWSYKELFITSIILYIVVFSSFLVGLTGCSDKPNIIIKREYIQKPTPVLQTVPVSELNLSKNKNLKLHIEVKEK